MENYLHDYREYNDVSYSIMDEKKSLDYLKNQLERLLTKAEIKQYSNSTTELAEYCHKKNVYYPITIYENGQPICSMQNRKPTFAVRFLDERLFWYISMGYIKYPEGKMFLDEIWVREYMHKEPKMLHDLKSDQHFQFTPEGGLKITTETIIRGEKTKIQREVKEAASPVNVSQNWQKIPEFGDYYYLADYEKIIKPGDLWKTSFGE